MTVVGPKREGLARLAEESGLEVLERGGDLSLAFKAATPDEALERLKLLAGLLAPKS